MVGLCEDREGMTGHKKQSPKLIEILKRLKTAKFISQVVYDRPIPRCPYPLRLYGLLKIHKPNFPFRSATDMSNSAYRTMIQWITELLERVRKFLAMHRIKN